MSLSFQPLDPVCVYDPRVMLNKHRTFPVLKSGSQTTFKSFTTTSVSSTSINFSCPPPSGGIIVDRLVFFYAPVRLTFTGIPAIGNTLLNPSNDAPRAFPIASSIETLSATINNQSMNINSADIIHALMRYNVDTDLKSRAYSMTPTYQDQSQSYNDMPIGSRNPLSLYADQPDGSQMARGGFPFTIVQNPVQAGAGVITAVVDIAICEPIFLSPFYTGKTADTGFINITTMDFNFTFVSQMANRMWSHNDGGASTVPFTSATAVFGGLVGGPTTSFPGGQQCQMLFQYITPQETMIIPRNMPISYPYYDTVRFPTDLPSANAGATNLIYNSNNIQLNSVPLRMYVYIRERNSDLYSNANRTDTFFQISNINVQFLNSSGLLASATFNSIYDLSRQNGCQLSYTQFGQQVNNNGWTGTFGTVGSVVCLDFAKNIGLPSLMAPGILSQCMVQIQVTASNISSRTINPTMYIVPISAGTFTVQAVGQCSLQIGVITPTDVLDCHNKGELNFNDVYDHSFSGGSFFDNLKDFGSKLMPYLQKAHDFIKENKLVSSVLNEIPGAQRFGKIAERIGYGEGEGGVMSGGAQLHRKDLRRRLAHY